MKIDSLGQVHIIGIGGCAASAIAELLCDNNVIVTGSEMKKKDTLTYLEDKGVIIHYSHSKKNLQYNNRLPDVVLYSPAVLALDPSNPELKAADEKNISMMSWQKFIGEYLNSLGKTGITVSGSEGKGTTAGILAVLLQTTDWDPLAILGAKIKNITPGNDSNIYTGPGKAYLLEADEFNRNFLNYHPSINIMINFQYEHPETYPDFEAYKKSFYDYFNGMGGDKKLIMHAVKNSVSFAEEYQLEKTHTICWFAHEDSPYADICDYIIKDHRVDDTGNSFILQGRNKKEMPFVLPFLPGYIAYNTTGALIAALELGLSYNYLKERVKHFQGMVRRFDVFKAKDNRIFITDYGHSPKAISHITNEIRKVFPGRKVHLVFQPHLFSRTYNFFDDFINELALADRVSLIDIYPARENPDSWKDKISSEMIEKELIKRKSDVTYLGKSKDIATTLHNRIIADEVTCFIGAGDMDHYYPKLFDAFNAVPYFKK